MTDQGTDHDSTRRAVMTVLAALPIGIGGAAQAATSGGEGRRLGSKTRVAYFSRSGNTLIPFVTHEGYGPGNSRAVIAQHAPKVRLLDGFVMEADQERRTMNQVNDWLETVKANG